MENVQAGQTIGPYRILQQIGQGGMATVYKAYQPAMDRYVALKILPRQLAESPEFIGRFRQEAHTIAHLEHAHILPVHDYGESDHYTYLAMRYVEAGTLKDRLEAGPLTPDEIDRYFAQLADALDYAHTHGVVHRDLKPSNVLLDARGNLFLTDFGIAKLLETDSRFTGTGALIGTPAYMSPEQAQGLAIDRRTDIYSLGIMLYEMLTERLPFEADTPLAIILKQISAPLPLPSSIKPGISPAVEQVLLKALAKNPDDRFATAAEFDAAWKAAHQAPATLLGKPQSPAGSTAVPALSTATQAVSGATAPDVGLPPAEPQVPAVRPRWRPRPGRYGLLAGGILLVVGLIACGGLIALLALNQQRRQTPARPTVPATAVAAAAAGTSTAGTGTVTAAAAVGTANTGTATVAVATGAVAAGTPAAALLTGPAHWHSWAAANNVLALTLFNGQLVSGGPGGVTTWKLADGTVASRLTTANGLPDPYVQALLADDQTHNLWIGTGNGLVAFDGQHTTLYDTSTGLDNNTVAAVVRTRRGLLAGTQNSSVDGGGLNLFDNGRWQAVAGFPSVTNTDAAPDHLSTTIRCILEDSKGNWWIGTTNGLGFYDGQTWKRFSTLDGLPNNEITSLIETDGAVWAGTSGGLAQLNGNAFVAAPETKDKTVRGMFVDKDGKLWLTGNGEIANRSAASGRWQTYDSSNFPADEVPGGLQAPDGTLYFASDAGVLRFDGRTFDLWAVPNVPTQAGYGLILPGQTSGQLWFVSSNYDHTDVFDQGQATWARIPSLPCDSCVPLAWGPDGRLWAASYIGMWIIQGANATHVTTDQGLPAGGTRAVAFGSDGSAWIGTEAGVAHYVGSAVTAVFSSTNAGLADDTVNRLLAAADGSLWVATNSDLSRRMPDGQWVHYGPGSPFQSDIQVDDLAQDAAGAVWVATRGEGAYRFAANAWTQFRPGIGGVKLPSSDVLSVRAARNASVWFGTAGAGAARFDGANWQAITLADGLINPIVNDIYPTDSGVVWFATGGGVTEYQP